MPVTIYDYDFEAIDVPRFYKVLKDLKFLVDLGDHFRFQVPNTDYYIFLTFCSFAWVYYPKDKEPEILSLEEILERIPSNNVDDILFNLDIFKQEVYRKKN